MKMMDTEAQQSQSVIGKLYVAAGWMCVGLGVIGAFLPVMPTTCFMIAALACFTKGSPRLAAKLLSHPRFGPPLHAWQTHRAIPTQVKAVAITSIALAFGIIVASTSSLIISTGVGTVLSLVAAYIGTRPAPPLSLPNQVR